MAIRTRTQFKTLYGSSGTVFPDNTTGEISEGDMRQFGEDIADSAGLGISTLSGTISSAEILNGFSVPPVLVPAPGAGLALLPIAFFIKLDYNSAPYATNTSFRLEMGLSVVSGASNITTMLPASADYWSHLMPLSNTLNSSIENTAIKLQVLAGNPTAGDSPIYFTVVYAICPTT